MWSSKSFPQILEASQPNDNGYSPPEKKLKEPAENSFLKEALDSCKSHEIGIEEASLIYGIPKRTLRAKLKDSNCSVIDENVRVFVLSLYPAEAESDLVGYLQDCIDSQVTMSAIEIRRFAYDLVCEKYQLTSLPREKNCILGQRWYKKFIEKYPFLDFSRNQAFKVVINTTNFYNTLENYINKFRLGVGEIYSVDGVELKFRASYVEDTKLYHRTRTIYTNAKAICCNNPVGNFVPPVFLKITKNNNKYRVSNCDIAEDGSDYQDDNFPESYFSNSDYDEPEKMWNSKIKNLPSSEDLLNVEKQIKMHLNKKLQPMSEENEEELREKLYEQFVQLQNKIISKSETSSNEISPEIFYDWFLGFVNHVKCNFQKKVLLLISDENYIKSFKIFELAKKHGVIFLVLPPHSAHKIYPLDGFAMSLNRNLSNCVRRWLEKNPDFKAHQVPLHVLFIEAYNETINPVIAKNGFLYSGIWPVNREIFESSELGGESVLLLNKSKSLMNESCFLVTADTKRNNLSLAGITNEADIGKLCRVCMKEQMYMKPLLETLPSFLPNYHGKKFSEITKVPISEGDGLPTNLCQYCLVQLIDMIKINELAVESHKKQLKLREAIDRMFFVDEESENQELLCSFQSPTTQVNDSKVPNRVITKNFDMNTLCRICMEEKLLLTSIFFRNQGGNILTFDTCDRIMEVSHCQVQIHDGLSSSICPYCRASINKASEFIQKAVNSDKILKEIVSDFRGNTRI